MERFLGAFTITNFTGILLILASLWLIKIIIKKESRNVFRGMLLFLLFLAAFLYFDQKAPEKWTFADLKETIFPTKQTEIRYTVRRWSSKDNRFIRYTFQDPYPRLGVTLDDKGRYFKMSNPDELNKVLKFLNIPQVDKGVPELASITGSQDDVAHFRWDNYPLGVMVIEKTLCQDTSSLETYQAILRITIKR